MTTDTQVVAPEILQIDLDPTVPELTADVLPAMETAALERRSKSQEEKGNEVEVGEKRNTSEAGLTDEGPPNKTFCWMRDNPDRPDRFSFQYVGDKYLMRDQEATSHLWCNMTLLGAQAISDLDELLFSTEYKKFTRSSLEVLLLLHTP